MNSIIIVHQGNEVCIICGVPTLKYMLNLMCKHNAGTHRQILSEHVDATVLRKENGMDYSKINYEVKERIVIGKR